MKKLYYLITILLILPFFSHAQDDWTLDPKDVESPDAIIDALYGVISGPKGEKRNWARFKALFGEEARLNPIGKDREGNISIQSWTPDEYVNRVGDYFLENGFFEEEIGRTTESFGNMMHLFSTYISKRTADGPVYQRGINSIQLRYDGTRYWIANIMWNAETEEFPIPEKYINK
ncbi:MAG: hypothetical protein AAFO07_28600 [Bacteroidota bacterium]